jgi:transcriptional regulator with XRE-family HTH domain
MLIAGNGAGFATRLQRERHARRWTQQEAIDRLKRLAHEQGYGQCFDGLDINALSRYENGHIRRPRAPLPELFAALYGVPAAVLFPAPRQPTPRRRVVAVEDAAGETVVQVLEALAHPAVRAQILALLGADATGSAGVVSWSR